MIIPLLTDHYIILIQNDLFHLDFAYKKIKLLANNITTSHLPSLINPSHSIFFKTKKNWVELV